MAGLGYGYLLAFMFGQRSGPRILEQDIAPLSARHLTETLAVELE
jgi:hypothetical protein